MAEKKKVINVRLVKGKGKRKARAKPKEKSRQKQKQRQTVNVQVSSGGSGGGGTSFIPMPQAPAFDYSLLASLIRPANTVDMPIRAMAPIPEPVQVRPAEEPTLVQAKKGGRRIIESESELEAENIRVQAPKESKAKSGAYRRKEGQSDEEYQAQISRYLEDKRIRERERTRLANEMRNIPVARAEAGRVPTFIGEEDVFGLGEK